MYPQSRIGRWLVLSALSVLLGSVFLGPLNVVERFLLDARFVFISQILHTSATSEYSVIVLMDQRSEEAIGMPFGSGWREFYPKVIDILRNSGARVIMLDLEFLAEEPEWDGVFARHIEAAGNVIAGEWEFGTTAKSLANSFAEIGSLRVVAVNGVPRRIDHGAESKPLSLLAADYFYTTPGDRSALGGDYWISYNQSPSYFPSFSFSDVFAADGERMADERRTPLSVFRDKAVLLGIDLPGVDRHVFPHTMGVEIPGVYGQAYAIETLLYESPLRTLSPPLNGAIFASFILVFCGLRQSQHRLFRWALVPLWPGLVFVLSVILLSRYHVWLIFAPLLISSITAALFHWLANRWALREGLRSAIGFDPDLVITFRRRATNGIVQEPAAILCADIRNYTQFVSGGDPASVSSVMNEYLHKMETVISANGGYVNKYVGDEIIAVFGFPLDGGRQAYRAVRSALAMGDALSRLLADWNLRGVDHFWDIGIGIDFGKVTFTEVGGRSKRQFDIIGNAINGASRIQTLTKEIGYSLAVSDEVVRELFEGDEERKLKDGFNPLGAYPLRGQGERLVYAHSGSGKRAK